MNKKIRFGLSAIKGLGEDTVDIIIFERNQKGKFKSLQDFVKRVPQKLINKKTVEALAFSGAFDEFGDRRAIVDSIEDLSRFAKEWAEKEQAGQRGLFGGIDDLAIDFTLKNTKATKEDILKWEKESLGFFVTDHPLKGLSKYFEKYGKLIGKLTPTDDLGKKRTLHGLVTNVKKIVTRKGKNMAIITIEDISGSIECAVFPGVYENFSASLAKDIFIRIRGKIDKREENLNCIVDEISVGDLAKIQNSREFFVEEKEGEENQAKQKILQIKIFDSLTKEKVGELKKFLLQHKKEFGINVEIIIQEKKVKIPFFIKNLDPQEIDQLKVFGEIKCL